MRLIKKQNALYYECICTGTVNTQEENAALAKMLRRIRDEGVDCYREDAVLQRFAVGMNASFERDGYLGNGKVTAKGEEIIETEKCWKTLRGQFKLGVVKAGDQQYVVSFQPYYKDERQGFSLKKGSYPQFVGEFENGNGMRIKDLKLDPNIYESEEETVELGCVYDYGTKCNSYTASIGNTTIEFPENKQFQLVDHSNSLSVLQQGLSAFGCFHLRGESVEIREADFSAAKVPLEQIFEKGEFSIDVDNCTHIESIRAKISESRVSLEVLLAYLEKYAEKQYLSKNEISRRISEFYDLFAECEDVGANSTSVFEQLLQKTSKTNKTAHLRLLAYRDLDPEVQEGYQSQMQDFSGNEMSIEDLVKRMLGDRDIVSVTALTKYAYKNVGISRAFRNFATALKRRYNIPLHLITAEDPSATQTEVAREYFESLEKCPDIALTKKEKGEIEKIHDRYYRVEKTDGNIEWWKMSGELDAIRYDGDFKDGRQPRQGIDEKTRGIVKEMTVVRVEESGIPELVRKVMEERNENDHA